MSAKDDHLTQDLLLQFLNGQIPPQRFVERCYRHLRATCSVCREEFTMAWVAQRSRGGFDILVKSILGRAVVLSGELDRVREVAEEELARLMDLSPPERHLAVAQATGSLRNPFLVTRLLEECKKLLSSAPHQALDLAELALDVAVRVDYRAYGASFTYDLVAQALGHKGNALRVLGELARADQVLGYALRVFAEEKADDHLTRAEVYGFVVSLRRDQRRFSEAESFLNAAMEVYRAVEQHRGVARLLIKGSLIAQERGDLDLALARIRQALALMTADEDPHLYFYARYDEALFLAERGDHAAARDYLALYREGIEGLQERAMDRWLKWLDARIAHALGDAATAEAGYRKVREDYLRAELPYDAAVISLDLALLYAEAREHEKVRELAASMLPVFQAREIHRDAFAALMLFHDAARAEKATAQMIRGLAAHLRAMTRDPERRRR